MHVERRSNVSALLIQTIQHKLQRLVHEMNFYLNFAPLVALLAIYLAIAFSNVQTRSTTKKEKYSRDHKTLAVNAARS